MRINLPGRASSPEHCAECGGPRDLPGRFCSECLDVPLLKRIGWRYENGEGWVTLFGSRSGRWEVSREFNPLRWGLGVEVDISYERQDASMQIGPWCFVIVRERS